MLLGVTSGIVCAMAREANRQGEVARACRSDGGSVWAPDGTLLPARVHTVYVICERAVADAQQGDSKARDWLSRHFLPAGKLEAEHHTDGKLSSAILLAVQQIGEEARRHRPQILDEDELENVFQVIEGTVSEPPPRSE